MGDFDNDGFPDILASVVNATAVPAEGGIFESSRSKGVQIRLLQNVECTKMDRADGGDCANGKHEAGRRKLKVSRGPVTDALSKIWDARGAAWLDIDENVSHSAEDPGTCSNSLNIGNVGHRDHAFRETRWAKNNVHQEQHVPRRVLPKSPCPEWGLW